MFHAGTQLTTHTQQTEPGLSYANAINFLNLVLIGIFDVVVIGGAHQLLQSPDEVQLVFVVLCGQCRSNVLVNTLRTFCDAGPRLLTMCGNRNRRAE